MLMGEYAVLYNKPALVCAIDKRITVTVTPRSDDKIEIESALGRLSTSLSDLRIEPPFQFVLGALQLHKDKMPSGCHIQIESEFSHEIGFGSSAAVTVATLAAVTDWLGKPLHLKTLVKQARSIIRKIQGRGSGADAAASVYGGIVCYKAQPLCLEKFSTTHPLTILYAGFKTSTTEVLERVHQAFADFPLLFKRIYETIGQCAIAARHALAKEDWTTVGKMMNVQQGLMDALGVGLPLLREMTDGLRSQSGILGAKMSGSGLGDCVIGLGHSSCADIVARSQVQNIPAAMTIQGVKVE